MKLVLEAQTKFACGLVLVGLLFVPMLIAGSVMLKKSPEFLKKRLDAKEKQGMQKGVVAFSGLMFIAGLYGIVRHPMYAVTILLFLMIPVVLGSWYALIVFCLLSGYVEYKQKVKFRIIPFVW